MTEITTTSWLIWTLSWLQSKKLQYKELISKLEIEVEESELVRRLMKWKSMLKALELDEIELKQQWLKILDKANIDKFEANWIEVRKKVWIWSLIIDDADKIDKDYKKEEVKTTIKIDKNAIKKDLKEWVIIDWVHLEQKISLEIKYS